MCMSEVVHPYQAKVKRRGHHAPGQRGVGPVAQGGSLMQTARITGDAQQVLNLTNITLQVQQLTIRQLTQTSMRDALAAIATMRR